jgi:hypothetical protein
MTFLPSRAIFAHREPVSGILFKTSPFLSVEREVDLTKAMSRRFSLAEVDRDAAPAQV